MIVSKEQCESLKNDFSIAIRAAEPKKLRTISQFALDEIILPPSGPKANLPFSFEYQPYVKLLFELIESGLFTRLAITGPTQTGKTFNALVVPAMYHLFEIGENVVYGIPTMAMAWDKWEQDLLPAIKASRYAELLPVSGAGSEGGKFESITFLNGATLKFMSAKGGDEKRSGFTSRVLLMTEIDKYDAAKEASRESDPVTQMIERLGAFEVLKTLVYMECTVSVKEGRIWQEYTQGSAARIALQCPRCLEHVTPEREHLIGWQTATNEIDARDWARFACPCCGESWTEEQRAEANRTAKLVHKEQTIDKDGVIHGPLPKTLTAGFRWSAVNNLFKPAADVAGREFKAKFAPDEQNSEKAMCQFVFATPVEVQLDITPLNVATLLERTHAEGRGIVPDCCTSLTVGIDLGGWWCHWTAIAYGPRARGYIIDYGRISVPQASLGLEAGLLEAMRQFRDLCNVGWTRASGEAVVPEENLLDSGWKTPLVYDFIRETGLPFRPCKGLSVSGEPVSYNRPKSTGAIVKWIGDGWHIAELKDDRIHLVEIDADEAKSTLHTRLNCDVNAAGAMTMFHIDRNDLEAMEGRRTYVRHLTAEKSVTEFKAGRGTITRWTKVRQANHYLDSTALALIGGSIDGVTVEEESDVLEPRPSSQPRASLAATVPVAPSVVQLRSVSQETSRGPVRPVRSGWVRKRSG